MMEKRKRKGKKSWMKSNSLPTGLQINQYQFVIFSLQFCFLSGRDNALVYSMNVYVYIVSLLQSSIDKQLTTHLHDPYSLINKMDVKEYKQNNTKKYSKHIDTDYNIQQHDCFHTKRHRFFPPFELTDILTKFNISRRIFSKQMTVRHELYVYE